MKIVGKSSERLVFEHRTWRMSLSILGISLFFALGLVKRLHQMSQGEAALGALVVACVGILGMALFETSRVTLDGTAGTVSFYRKRALRVQRMTLPLEEFRGVLSEKVTWHEGWNYRIALVFRIEGRTWMIPASVGTSKNAMRGIVDQINTWRGIRTAEVEALTSAFYTDKTDPIVSAGRSLRRAVRSRRG